MIFRILSKRNLLLFLVFCLGLQTGMSQTTEALIKNAIPVWATAREKEMNLSLGFRAVFKAKENREIKLKIAASTIYRVFLNGEFVGSGPARAAHDYFRVDEYLLEKQAKQGENIIAVEVAGYNINTYYTLDQPSFLQAELEIDGKIVLATGKNSDFEAFQLNERLQKVERYSFQRPFTEYYRMSASYDKWRSSKSPVKKLEISEFPKVKLLKRNILMPDYTILKPALLHSKGKIKKIEPEKYYKDRSLVDINAEFKGFPESELEVVPSLEIQKIANANQEIINKNLTAFTSFSIIKDEFCIYGFDNNYSGFIGAKIHCNRPSRLIFYFDEMLTEDDVNQKKRMRDINNQIVYELEAGDYSLETIEAYTLKFLKIIVTEGDCRIDEIYIREFAYPENKNADFVSSSPKLNKIFEAAKQSSRQNALDVFMDCPSRERAGWLCDSYYAAIMEKDFTGYSTVAHNFYENYALPESFAFLPEGMIPMCYPADHYNGNFIPQWSLWFIIQIEDYMQRGGNPDLINRLKPKIENLLKYFSAFENSDGLLERLNGWKFVEWSKANNFVNDVSYPTNMLYSFALNAASQLYGNPEWAKKAEQIKQTVLKQSFNGEFFVDNAMRRPDKLEIMNNITETCQYYAFFFGIATPESHPDLLNRLIKDFGAKRKDKEVYPNVFRANAFMGNYMRMDILSQCNLQSLLMLELQDYFYPMAEKTGTLWEHMENSASCNHGFASYIGHVLYRDILGISKIDYIKKEIEISFNDLPLESCSGSIPIENDFVQLKWQRSENQINYSLKMPAGFSVKINNRTSLTVNSYQ